jgi:uncharacterized protein with PIN domain
MEGNMQHVARLACDAMLGKLARWLRAAGQDADWHDGIDDEHLVRRARDEGRILVTSDGPLMAHRLIRDGTVRAVFVPVEYDTVRQLRHVLGRLSLRVGPARCMACGGELTAVSPAEMEAEVPPRVRDAHQDFRRCTRCRKLYWPGTHWRRIQDVLRTI